MATITHTYSNHRFQHPDRIAIHTQDHKISYDQWFKLICKTANWLTSLQVSCKRIAILMHNGIPFLQLFAGASAAGWIVAPLDVKWQDEELQKRMKLCSPSIIITTRNMKDKLVSNSNVVFWEDCIEEIDQSPIEYTAHLSGEHPFYMGFTSGSTGEPKAFVRAHASWAASFECNTYDFQMKDNEHVVIPGALIHSHFLYGAISTLFLGGTIYLLEKFTPYMTLSLLKEYPITVIYLVPTMIEAILKEKDVIEKQVTIISSGAKWEPDSKQRIRKMFPNLCMYEFYGASELSFVTVLSNQENIERPGSVGRPCYNVEIQIRKKDGTIASPYEAGKIFVRSNMVFMGYIETNCQRIQSIQDKDGWSTVHDMGYVDESGYLYIMGREKNMILYGGMNIFSEEIEAVLSSHPKVEDVAVIGLPDRYWGQVVAAVIKGKALKQELRKFCKTMLASYKVPRKWYFVDQIPLTTSGKIARSKVKEIIEQGELS
ncbi:AMP-binding protein [Heyndrickxia sp. NPDC080065]|uniref:AMP-binding protein n=1 Tax=Heyndrickxia sp. NPDC080065 TaxID=3390568 RepID=UPI003D03415A